MSEDEMVGWHHQLNRHEFEKSPGVEMDRCVAVMLDMTE